MAKYVEKRYAVDAVFDCGGRVTLRDFHHVFAAQQFLNRQKPMDLYPGRPYRLEIVPYEVTESYDLH